MSDDRPFANGTERDAWMAVWCQSCAHDHTMHTDTPPGCELLVAVCILGEFPDEWTPEPAGEFHLPPLHVCHQYAPCDLCGGDPQPEIRAKVINHTMREAGG